MFVLGVLSIMSLFFTNISAAIENKNPKIVVIGAGLGGLTAAYRLQQSGMDVDVYEARNRVGGRVFTVNVNGNQEELGGQNITDGGDAENLRNLLAELNLELVEHKVDLTAVYLNNGEVVSMQDLMRKKGFNASHLKQQLDTLAARCTTMREVLDEMFAKEDPLHTIFATRLACYEGGDVEKLSSLYVNTLYHMLLGGICQVHQENELEDNAIGIWTIKGGNASLPETMAAKLGNRLHLNKVLSHVSQNADGSIKLVFEDKGYVTTDILLLANPCPTYHHITFEENIISKEKLQFIKNVQYGTNAKILVPHNNLSAQRAIIGADGVVGWGPKGGIFVLYHTGQNSFFSSDTIAEIYRQHGSILVETNIADQFLFPIDPVYARDQNFSIYKNAVGHSWPHDPYAGGSYSYIAAGQEELLTTLHEKNDEVVKSLFEPIDKKIYFAGEHASILMDVPGTMEAACESGERAARMILNDLRSAHKKNRVEDQGMRT